MVLKPQSPIEVMCLAIHPGLLPMTLHCCINMLLCEQALTANINHCCKLVAYEHIMWEGSFLRYLHAFCCHPTLCSKVLAHFKDHPAKWKKEWAVLFLKKDKSYNNPPVLIQSSPQPPPYNHRPVDKPPPRGFHTPCVCVFVCAHVHVCMHMRGQVACATVAIPLDCQRGSWEI